MTALVDFLAKQNPPGNHRRSSPGRYLDSERGGGGPSHDPSPRRLSAFWPFDPLLTMGNSDGRRFLSTRLAVAAPAEACNPRERRPTRRPFWEGLAVIILALASPIEPFASLFLQIHMLQHVLLMMVAPPLLWLGAPLFPMLRGLPRPVRTYWVAPLLPVAAYCRSSSLGSRTRRSLFHYLSLATYVWHVPAWPRGALAASGRAGVISSTPQHSARHAVLVFRSSAPIRKLRAMVGLAAPAVLDCRRRPKHRSRGAVDVLQSGSVSALCRCPASGRHFRPGRPVNCGRPDVGARFAGLSSSPLFNRGTSFVRPGRQTRRRAETETRRRGDRETRKKNFGSKLPV